MRIAFIINDASNIGGTERVTTHFASVCAERGQDVVICSLHQSKDELFFPVHQSVELSSLMSQPVSLFKQLLPIAKKLRQLAKQFDVIILSDSQLGVLLPFCRKAGGAKWLVWEHFNSTIETTFGSRWFGRRAAALLSDMVVVLTEQDKANWQQKYWLKSPVVAIPNPCSVRISAPRERLNSHTVVSVGRFTAQKGFDLLIGAWAALPANLTKQWQLHIVGPNGSAKTTVQQQIKELGLTNVVLKDATQTITDEFDAADIYVMASRYEGFGLTLIEAMSRGLPSIAFDCPMGPAEILNYGEFGEVVPAQNTAGLTQAMRSIMESPPRYFQRSKASIKRAESYQDANIYKHWQSVWQKIGLLV